VNRNRPRQARSGCSGLGGLLFFLLAIGAIIGWPMYLESQGTPASAVISDKQETVRIPFDEWFRRFQIYADYSIPGQSLRHRAVCDVDESTYDSLHRGNTISVHYFANLLNQPFLPATHLSPCSTAASIGGNPLVLHRLLYAFLTLMAILFLWRVLRIRIAAWLLLPWLGLCFAYFLLPRVEPEPQQPVPSTATIGRVETITTLGGLHDRKSIPLQHPYQIVLLKFVPPGFDDPVTAVDKVDAGSVPNLKQGDSADILYDPAHPRIARLRQGTRSFPGRALTTVVICCVVFAVLLSFVWAVGAIFRFLRRAAVR
jgi:hypothetical protein